MKRFWVLLLALGVFQGSTDLDALQGTWRVTDARARMSNEPAMILDGDVGVGTVQFIADTVILRQLASTDLARFTFTLDTVSRPRRIRLVDGERPDSARWVGLYMVVGDTLRLSLPIEHFSDRPVAPTGFNAPNTVAYQLTRVR